MRQILIASGALASLLAVTSASAADLPYAKAPVMAAVYDWTGFYIGTNLGYSWGRGSTTGTQTRTVGVLAPAITTLPLTGRADVNGFVGGGQFGYNWQRGSWLFGLESDIQLSGERGSGDVCSIAGCPAGSNVFTRDYKLDWFGTGRGRVGFLPAERLLIYATGGLAYGTFSGSSWTLPLNIGTWSSLNVGWTAGAGLEMALGSNWTVKFEYLYLDLGNAGGSSATITGNPGNAVVFNTRFTDNIVRVGVNYRFGDGVVARY